jgi:hypothetical protein
MSSAGLVFYREVCRAIRKLPKETQSYYRVVAREKVVAHRDEDVPDRIDSIIRRSREDVAWVLKKYSPSREVGEYFSIVPRGARSRG